MGHHQNAVKIEFIFVIEGNGISDINYNNIMVTHNAHPIGKIIVPPKVILCWEISAELLTTSHTLNHQDGNIDIIQAIKKNADDNVAINLTKTLQSSPQACMILTMPKLMTMTHRMKLMAYLVSMP
eukprot:1624839-Ditylum_brightwellii.AAC.1